MAKTEAMNQTRYEIGGAARSYDEAPAKGNRFRKTKIALKTLGVLSIVGLIAGCVALIFIWRWTQSLDVPSHEKLADYEPAVTTRVHAGDGSLAAEFARERRLFVPIEAIPDTVKQAFIAAEDKGFYEHSGLDYKGIVRAAVRNVRNKIAGSSRLEGASTITQQVAKNFLLSSDQRMERKAKEALIARNMESAFTKDEILELYLNEIYLGNRSYGVAAASLNYFGKPLDELNAAEAAYLATLAKGPSNYHPVRGAERAVTRRNWIIGQMGDEGYLTASEVADFREMPLGAEVAPPLGARSADSEYFAETVRKEVAEKFGVEALYDGGLSIRTTLDPRLQDIAQNAFRSGLEDYDRRHGWRGPLAKVELPTDLSARGESEEPELLWVEALQATIETLAGERKISSDLAPWRVGVVLGTEKTGAVIGFVDGTMGTLPLSDLQRCESCVEEGDHWARAYGSANSRRDGKITKVSDVVTSGDVVYVEPVSDEGDDLVVSLRQIPAVNGALIAIDPHTGRVLAMVGGYSFGLSEFNRANQAWRQPGSTFKPFVYAAALEQGYTPSSIVLDAPFVAEGANGNWWKPGNYVVGRYYGESTLRLGIEKSRNTMTARLAQDIGVGSIIDVAQRFGVSETLPRELSISLGAGETTLMRLTTAYAEFVNGGRALEPVLIDRIQDRYGRTVFKNDERPCYGCDEEEWDGQGEPQVADGRGQVVDPRVAYQMVSIMEGVIDRGTGARINRFVDPSVPLAGKTGTTDDYRDAWFVGFSPDLAVGIYVGFDTPATMGEGEGGGIVAAPIFGRFMEEALKGENVVPFRAPSGIRMVRVNAKTGRPASAGDPNVILEAFKAEDNLDGNRFDVDRNRGDLGRGEESVTDDLGGIY